MHIIEKMINWRQDAPALSLGEDGIEWEGFDHLAPTTNQAGEIDYDATSARQYQAAKAHFLQAITPDLAAMLGALGYKTGSTGTLVGGAMVGLAADGLEATPQFALGVMYMTTAAINKGRSN